MKPYQRLPGRRLTSLMARHSLWLGEDHLLKVTLNGYREEYRRFFFRDIGAFVVCRTRRWMIWNLSLGGAALVFGLIGAALVFGGGSSDAEGFGFFLLMFPAAFSLLGLIINLLRGPTCSFIIQTAVQSQEIPSVGRIRTAEKVIARLTPLVQAAQPAATTTPAFVPESPAAIQPAE
jgi:hypothetical protein